MIRSSRSAASSARRSSTCSPGSSPRPSAPCFGLRRRRGIVLRRIPARHREPDRRSRVKRLQLMSKALTERPALKLEIAGRADPKSEKQAIERQRLEARLKVLKRRQAGGGDAAGAPEREDATNSSGGAQEAGAGTQVGTQAGTAAGTAARHGSGPGSTGPGPAGTSAPGGGGSLRRRHDLPRGISGAAQAAL